MDWGSVPGIAVRRIFHFLRRNPWTIPILCFQVLLVSCVVLLILGFSVLAESVSVVAYFVLLFGVIAQLILFRKDKSSE